MHKETYGKLVQSLRKEHRDVDGRSWTQQILAQKAGVEKRTIERIEQGALQKLDHDIVLSLADALELTTRERQEFFFAAMGLDNQHLASPGSDPRAKLLPLLRMLESIKLPAMVVDVYADVLAVNTGAIQLYGMYDDLVNYPADAPAAHNILRLMFTRESMYRRILGDEWSRNAMHNIRVVRGISLRYRFHPYFKQLLSALWKLPTFRIYWEQAHLDENDSTTDSLMYAYTHPNLGPIHYMANASSSVTSAGSLHWVIYVPMDQRTTVVFGEMIERRGNEVIRLANWPKE